LKVETRSEERATRKSTFWSEKKF